MATEVAAAPQSRSGSRIPQYVAAVTVNLALVSYGAAVGWSANALPHLQSPQSTLSGGAISDEDASWLASSLCLTAVPATALFSLLCTRIGCKLSGYLVTAAFVASWLLVLFAPSVAVLHVARLAVGFAAGGGFVVSNNYVRDIAESAIRGTLSTFLVLFINVGIVFGYIIGSCFSYQTVNIISMCIPILFAATFFWLPETPRYLLSRDRHQEAAKALQWLRGANADITEELDQIKASVKLVCADGSKPASLKDLFTPKRNLISLTIGVVLCMNQQLSGFFGIINYSVTIFKESGSELSPNASSIIVGFMLIAGTYVSSLLVERAGRKSLLLISDITMAICLAILGIYFYLKDRGHDLGSVGWLPVTCLSVFVTAMSIGLFPLPYVILTEIFSPNIREMASSIGIATTWILAFVIAKVFTVMSDTFGLHGSYWIFCAFCLMGTVFIIFVVPETKGRSLESIQQQFEGKRIKSSQECTSSLTDDKL